MENNKPGDVIQPAAEPMATPTKTVQPPTGQSQIPAQAVSVEASAANHTAEPTPVWQYNGTTSPAPSASGPEQPVAAQNDLADSITWSAAEFIHHEKSTGWYAVLIGSGVILIGLVYLITHDKITSTILGLAVIALAVFAARKPKTIEYEINGYALRIGQQIYDFTGFKSFAIYEEGNVASVVLMPLKRFMPPLMVYLEEQSGTAVIDILGERLPLLQRPQDSLDSLLRRLRF